tara:strand:+ start:639 stop:758 length:120 start_codon:yes stop_codon:yes gene_type:complete
MFDFDPFGLKAKALMDLLDHLHMQLIRIEKKLDEVLEHE